MSKAAVGSIVSLVGVVMAIGTIFGQIFFELDETYTIFFFLGVMLAIVPGVNRPSKVSFDGKTVTMKGSGVEETLAVMDINSVQMVPTKKPMGVENQSTSTTSVGRNHVVKETWNCAGPGYMQGVGQCFVFATSKVPVCIVLETEGMKYAVNFKDEESTKSLYDEIELAVRGKSWFI